jgi:hypothetical protein
MERFYVEANLPSSFAWAVDASCGDFTPIVASRYGYALLWALLLAVSLKWFIREVGRFAVCTGTTILTGGARRGGAARALTS